VDGDLKSFRVKTFRQHDACQCFGGKVNVKDGIASVAKEMAMIMHVWAKTSCAAVQLHLADEAAFDERIETIIDGCVGDFGHLFFCADKNLIGRRMIALVQQDIINALALRREPEAERAQAFADIV